MCTLGEEQGKELHDVVGIVNDNFPSEPESLFSQHKEGDIIKKIWENDVKQNRTDFLKDQSKNYGNTGNRFNVITYQVALSVFSRSPAAYEALRSFNILTLPSVSTLKTFMRPNVEDPGPVYGRMAEEQKNYQMLQEFQRKLGKPVPAFEGALIFDEVKVTASIYWNAKSNKFISHALTHENMSTVHDIYRELDNRRTAKASYILQFLWSDVSSSVHFYI